MRTIPTRLATAVLASLLAVATFAGPAAGQAGDDAGGAVDVIEVSGYLDPIVVDFVEHSLAIAEEAGAVVLLLQLDSPGAVVSEERFQAFLDRLASSPVPVTVWVGPSGAQAAGEAAELVAIADVAALAPGSHLRPTGGRSFGSDDAVDADLTDFGGLQAAGIGDFIVSLADHGIPVQVREIRDGDEVRREPVTQTRFAQLPLLSQLLHTVASPPVAYLLLVIGMALLLFELFTAGVGVAGLVGAGSVALAGYGLAVLPTNPAAVGLLVLAMVGFGIDVQTGVPRVWTGIATVAYVVGSLVLYRDGISLSWITLLLSVAGMLLAMLAGMPAMVRTRFSTPTIGREWMVGEAGEARTAVDPEGTVLVRDAPWRARTNRATPIPAGARVRVAAIDGLVLEVEPVDGAAKDYRR